MGPLKILEEKTSLVIKICSHTSPLLVELTAAPRIDSTFFVTFSFEFPLTIYYIIDEAVHQTNKHPRQIN